MKAVLQRARKAYVTVDNESVGAITKGLVVFLGVGKDDTEQDLDWLFNKIIHLRIFPNEQGKFDRSLLDISGQILLISQFTLFGDCRKGRRPGFDSAADPIKGKELYQKAIKWLMAKNIPVETGQFGAMMDVHLINDGPVTILLDTETIS